jgi:hypothetical protein
MSTTAATDIERLPLTDRCYWFNAFTFGMR